MEQKVERYISIYEKHGKNHLGEINIPDDSLSFLRDVFRPPENDPLMYNSYSVGRREGDLLCAKYGLTLNLDKYDYFVEAGYVTI